jgi:hypothetical protein
MRSLHLRTPAFAAGFTLGLVLTGVTFALGRVVKRRAQAKVAHPVIDGAKPINPRKLEIGPETEPTTPTIRLESEMVDPPVNSQRW